MKVQALHSNYVKWTNQYVNTHLNKKWTGSIVHLYNDNMDVANDPE